MGNKITLAVTLRTVHGKKVRQLRDEGFIPAVVYGPGIEPMSVQIPEAELKKTVKEAGKHTPVYVKSGGKSRITMIKDVDIDPVKGAIRHVSFHAVKADELVTTDVAIRLTGEGESEAEKAGLIILQSLDRIEIKALPMDLPEALEVSIAHLKEEGERVTVEEIKLPEGVEYVEHVEQKALDDDSGDEEETPSIRDLVVASVWEPGALQAANEATAGDAEDVSEVESENGAETVEESAGEDRPGGKAQAEPKQSNVDANKK